MWGDSEDESEDQDSLVGLSETGSIIDSEHEVTSSSSESESVSESESDSDEDVKESTDWIYVTLASNEKVGVKK